MDGLRTALDQDLDGLERQNVGSFEALILMDYFPKSFMTVIFDTNESDRNDRPIWPKDLRLRLSSLLSTVFFQDRAL